MERIEKTVFISYRRTNVPWALAIYQNLTQHGYDVFFDYTGIASGDFERVIIENIKARAHFVVLLTPSALERCSDPNDWLRREIETALATQRNIVPLMLEGFDFSTPAIARHLIGKLAQLKSYNALSVPAEYFAEAMSRLRERYLTVPLKAVLHPVGPATKRDVKAQQSAAGAAPTVGQKQLTAQEWYEQGYQLDDNSDEEIRCYTEAIRLKPDYVWAYNNRGVARTAQGDVDGAIKDLDKAIELDPQFALAYNNRGRARYDQGDLAGAIQDYDMAIELDPQHTSAYAHRGLARYDQGDLASATQDFDSTIELDPQYAWAYAHRGLARYDQGDLVSATQDFDKTIELDPQYAWAYANRGRARYDQGDLAGAIQDYDMAIELDPQHTWAYANRGLARYNQGGIAGAIQDYGMAIEQDPQHTWAYYNRGLACYNQGDIAGATQDYDMAIELDPQHVSAYYNRGLAHKAQGNLAPAIADYQKYLDLGGGVRDGDQAEVEKTIRDLRSQLRPTA